MVFHCIVFPAMLMAWNDSAREQYVLPDNVPANEFLNFEGQKFSKSRGWGIDVQDFLARYPADPLRYYLAVIAAGVPRLGFHLEGVPGEEQQRAGRHSREFRQPHARLRERTFDGRVPPRGPLLGARHGRCSRLSSGRRAWPASIFEQYRFRDGFTEVMNLARAANKYFNDSEPWKTAKSDPAAVRNDHQYQPAGRPRARDPDESGHSLLLPNGSGRC